MPRFQKWITPATSIGIFLTDHGKVKMLTRDKIISYGLLHDFDDRNLLSTTYDLTIGRIVVSRDRASGEAPRTSRELLYETHYEIPPQGMALIISKEALDLPGNITGMQYLKNTLSRKGILAINTGIIDPNYSGPLSTVLVNFSNSPYPIESGDQFSRLVFFSHENQEDIRNLAVAGLEHIQIRKELVEKYSSERSREFLSKVGGTFLNMKSHAEEIQNVALRTAVPKIAYFLSTIVICIAALGLTLQSVNGFLNLSDLQEKVSALRTELEVLKSQTASNENQ